MSKATFTYFTAPTGNDNFNLEIKKFIIRKN